jgi:AraC-like DNA-binding protein
MGLLAHSSVANAQNSLLAFDDWSYQLQSVCGNYHPARFERGEIVTGYVRILHAGGLDVAHIATDLGEVRREDEDIRRDYGENLFLLIQLEGVCGIEQRGRESVITPGDCVLIDSSRPSVFHFDGKFSNHLSVHMPRQLLFSKNTEALEISRKIDAEDPMAAMLSALVAKLADTDARDKRAPHLRQLLFDATRQAFATEDETDFLSRTDTTGARLEIVQVLIDRHLTEENLTPRWLASKLGISLRTLQDDFNEMGTTATSLIRMRRLHLAHEQLVHCRQGGEKPNIAELAYSTGFNDVSYFNRSFRQLFDCTPKDLLNADQ